MAGWLSSKLKEAEQFLQQIDQQAAESLGKPETPKPADRQERHGKREPIAKHPYADPKDFLREASTRGKLDLMETAPSSLSSFVKKADQGLMVVNGSGRYDKKDSSMYKKKQSASGLQIAGDLKHTGKDDWTELLASPSIDLVSSPALASSVGSSDLGRSGYVKGSSVKPTVNQGKKGVHRQQIGYPSFSAEPATKGSTLVSETGPSTDSSKADSVHTSMMVLSGEFGDQTLPRRLEPDLAQLDHLDTEINNKGLASETSKNTGSLVHMDCLNLVITKGTLDDQKSLHTPESIPTEKAKEDAAGDSEESQNQQEDPRRLSKQVAVSPRLASEYKNTSTQPNQSTVVPSNDNLTQFRSIRQPDLRKPGGSLGGGFNGFHGIKKQGISIRDSPEEIGENTMPGTHIFADGRDLDEAHEMSNVELLLETQAAPTSLQSDERSYDSSSMSDDTDSDRATESEDDEDVEMEKQKFAHKRRIARRKELTAARAAAAEAAIRDRELFVEKLEKEVITLRQFLAEREEQQSRKAVELRMSIAELMTALETEKKLHSSTRMKALAVESQLENQNAELAKSLGALQWGLDEQTSHILKAQSMIDSKEVVKGELQRSLAKMRDDLYHQQNGKLKLAQKSKDEDCSFEDEHSDLWKKIQLCQIQVKDLEVKIHGLQDTQRVPTDIEQELEKRLTQMTDYLLQKQAQVEALATEKATLLIRIEAVSNTIEEERAMASSQASRNKLGGRRISDWDSNYYDMEYALGRSYDSKSKHSVYELGESSAANGTGSVPLSPVLRQLNGFVSAGIFFLRKHRWVQAFAMIYIIILHWWVWFVVFMNSKHTHTLSLQEFALPKNISELKDVSNVTNML